MSVRAHIVLPEELLDEVDDIAGKRKRSQFVEEAIREKLLRAKQSAALRATAGSIDLADYPEWSTPEAISAWAHANRQTDTQRANEKVAPNDAARPA